MRELVGEGEWRECALERERLGGCKCESARGWVGVSARGWEGVSARVLEGGKV